MTPASTHTTAPHPHTPNHPWGATEAHNFHLPLATDTIQVSYIAEHAHRLATERGSRLALLPAIPFGVQTGQLDIPFCINMNPSTQAAVLRDAAASLARQGCRKLCILNGHGGNDFRSIIRELSPQLPIFLCVVNWYAIVDPRPFFAIPGDHAGEMETSVMLHIAPNLVRPLSTAGPGAEHKLKLNAFREGWAWTPRHWPSATSDTGVGDPRAATAEKGRAYLDALIPRLASFFVDLAGADPDSLYSMP
jgi:creatinine amidohydrolase